jgi:hypothetical protein
MSFIKQATTACAFATLAMIGLDAAAATVRVSCEVRPGRAKISVDGKSLAAGSYSTVVVSGASMATSAPAPAVGGEVETDYDSNPADIRAGAVAIPATFVVGGSVTGKVVDASGNTVIADTVSCRVKSR